MSVRVAIFSVLIGAVLTFEDIPNHKYELNKFLIKNESSNTISTNIEEKAIPTDVVTLSTTTNKHEITSSAFEIDKQNTISNKMDDTSISYFNDQKTTISDNFKETSKDFTTKSKFTTLKEIETTLRDHTIRSTTEIENTSKTVKEDTLYTTFNNTAETTRSFIKYTETPNVTKNETTKQLIKENTLVNKLLGTTKGIRTGRRLITEEVAKQILNDHTETLKPNTTNIKPTTNPTVPTNPSVHQKEDMSTSSSQTHPVNVSNYEVYENLVDIPDDRVPIGPVVAYTPPPVLNTVKPDDIKTTTFLIPIITTETGPVTNVKPKKHCLDIFHFKAEYDDQNNQATYNNGFNKVSGIIKSISDCLSLLHKGFMDGIHSLFKGKRDSTNGWKKKRSVETQR